jgi:hypothetical protein
LPIKILAPGIDAIPTAADLAVISLSDQQKTAISQQISYLAARP